MQRYIFFVNERQLDIGRTPIILRAALPSWCGSDVETNSGGQGIKALTSAYYYIRPLAKLS